MIVWVEGADGSGKSTLVDRLCGEYGFERVKIPEHVLEPTEEKAVDENIRWNRWWETYGSKSIKKPLIVERGHISEMVYRINDARPTYLVSDMIQKHLCGTKIIYCETSTAFEDAMKRGEDRTTSKVLHAQLCSDYRTIVGMLCRFYNCDCCKYNWKDDNIAQVIKFINN